MTKAFTDNLGMLAGLKQQAGVSVPQVMESYLWQFWMPPDLSFGASPVGDAPGTDTLGNDCSLFSLSHPVIPLLTSG
jgi:hypothetical protein